jgi:hypothetical protein
MGLEIFLAMVTTSLSLGMHTWIVVDKPIDTERNTGIHKDLLGIEL